MGRAGRKTTGTGGADSDAERTQGRRLWACARLFRTLGAFSLSRHEILFRLRQPTKFGPAETGRKAAMEPDRNFQGAIAEAGRLRLAPMLFAPYADDMVSRLAGLRHGRVLETAAGTGVFTRALVAALPGRVSRRDRPQSADARPCGGPSSLSRVIWRQADAHHLPFSDREFDAVVCQFGAMFFPDKPRAFAEAYRVLKPGGRFLFRSGTGSRRTSSRTSWSGPSRPYSPTTRLCFSRERHMAGTIPLRLQNGFGRQASKASSSRPFRGRARRRTRSRLGLDTVRARRCGTRSRLAMPLVCRRRRRLLRPRSPRNSAPARLAGRCGRTHLLHAAGSR